MLSRLDDDLTNRGKRTSFKGGVGLRKRVEREEVEIKEPPSPIRTHTKLCSSRNDG